MNYEINIFIFDKIGKFVLMSNVLKILMIKKTSGWNQPLVFFIHV